MIILAANSEQHLVQIISCSIYVLFKASMPAVVRVRPLSCLSSPVCVVTCYAGSFSAISGMQLGQWSNNSSFRVSLWGGAHSCYGCHCGWRQLCKGECVTTVVSPVFSDGRQGGCQRPDKSHGLASGLILFTYDANREQSTHMHTHLTVSLVFLLWSNTNWLSILKLLVKGLALLLRTVGFLIADLFANRREAKNGWNKRRIVA